MVSTDILTGRPNRGLARASNIKRPWVQLFFKTCSGKTRSGFFDATESLWHNLEQVQKSYPSVYEVLTGEYRIIYAGKVIRRSSQPLFLLGLNHLSTLHVVMNMRGD